MWTSYEALCEMGAVDIDPTSVFGVRPAELEQLQENHLQKMQHNKPLQEKSLLSPSLFSHHQSTPMEAVKPLQPMDLGTPSSSGSIPKTSLFQTAQKRTGQKERGTVLQFETPNLTPIPIQDVSFAQDSTTFVDSANPSIIRRAKHVAARLYYQPSPETPDSLHRAPTRYLVGLNGGRGVGSSLFSDTVGETPLRRGGRQDISTTRRPRALFLTSENKTNNTTDNGDGEEPSMADEEKEDDHQKPTSTLPYSGTSEGTSKEKLEEGISSKAVQDILELLCLLGAAWWRLCQVCRIRIDRLCSV